MNIVKVAAAFHALADALLEGENEEQAPAPAKGKRKAATPAAPVEQPAAPVTQAAPLVETPAAPPAPTITKEKLNKAVLAVAAKGRDKAEAILARFNAKNTVTLPPEQWQAVYDAFEEELAKIDAAAVQVAQASLV